jgi:hypothetical protein
MCGWESQETGDDGQGLVTSALTCAKISGWQPNDPTPARICGWRFLTSLHTAGVPS